jgi:transposase-like protein
VSGKGVMPFNGCESGTLLLRPWLAVHKSICKDNLVLYLAAFKAHRRFRSMKPIEIIKEILRNVFIFMAS